MGVSAVATANASEPTMRRAMVRSSLKARVGGTLRLFTFDSEHSKSETDSISQKILTQSMSQISIPDAGPNLIPNSDHI